MGSISESSLLERIVSTGLQGWIEVGEALIEIRDSRLYRIEAGTFEEYCQSKFKMEKRHAYQLMQGAPIAREVCATAHISNKATLELAKVAPEKRQEVFEKATEAASGHVPTARVIKEVIEAEEVKKPATKPNKTPRVIIDCADELWREYLFGEFSGFESGQIRCYRINAATEFSPADMRRASKEPGA